ncbi:hypothetical protein [Aeromicrobium sp. UC242_57]|uniref:hypothetical protein n=1 Tax=Aeromicrobium sp. UC242_57 TaxID=3374624 RepID=UPI0037953184
MAWWPAVRVTGYDGDRMTVRATSAFGYGLTFSLTDLTTSRPDRLTFAAEGDLRGEGIVTFRESAPGTCEMEIDWRVATDRRWMRATGWFLRPVFVAGHALIMRQGERHLNAWLRLDEPMR